MFQRREDEVGPGSNPSKNPVRHQHPRDHVVDQRGAKTRPLQREGKLLLQHLEGSLEVDRKKQRRMKKRLTSPKNLQKRNNENSQLILPHSSVFLFLVEFWD